MATPLTADQHRLIQSVAAFEGGPERPQLTIAQWHACAIDALADAYAAGVNGVPGSAEALTELDEDISDMRMLLECGDADILADSADNFRALTEKAHARTRVDALIDDYRAQLVAFNVANNHEDGAAFFRTCDPIHIIEEGLSFAVQEHGALVEDAERTALDRIAGRTLTPEDIDFIQGKPDA